MLRSLLSSLSCRVALLGGLVAAASPAMAQDWQALVLGQPGRNAELSFADAFHASEAVRLSVTNDVSLLRDVDADTVVAALETLAGAPNVLIYYSGPLALGTAMLAQGRSDPRLDLATMLEGLAAGGTTQVALLIEDCAGRSTESAGLMDVPVPVGLSLFLGTSAGPDGVCPAAGGRLTDMLKNAPGMQGQSLQTALAGVQVLAQGAADIMLAAPAVPVAPEMTIIDVTSPVVSIVADTPAALSPVMEPIAVSAPAITPSRPAATPQAGDGETIVVFAPPPQSQLAALPLVAGLPSPSIIVGLIEGASDASFGQALESPADISANEISYDNLDARRALRAQSPELFASLVEGGAFDPPDNLLPWALQTELARMGCYTAGIDGDWGRGSRASVNRYFDEIEGVSATSQQPTVELFRQIIVQDNVTCPAPAPVARAAPAQGNTTTRATTQRAAPAQRTQRAAPDPARRSTPAPAPRINKNRLGTGVFR